MWTVTRRALLRCSGAMKAQVPITAFEAVNALSWPIRCAIPKSVSLGTPSSETSTLWGLMSRWITPLPWASTSAERMDCEAASAVRGSR